MSRLAHLKVSLPRLLSTGLDVLLIDYSCPEHSGDWAEQLSHPQRDNLSVLRIPGKHRFQKAKAYNQAAQEARSRGYTHLFFLDADTHVAETLGNWCRSAILLGDRFYIFEPLLKKRDLYGALLTPTTAFFAAGTYDEEFSGWGLEDMDMRFRLALKAKLPFGLIPASLATPISHGNDLRVKHYAEKDTRASSAKNFDLLRKNIRRWTGGIDILMLKDTDNLKTLIKLWK